MPYPSLSPCGRGTTRTARRERGRLLARHPNHPHVQPSAFLRQTNAHRTDRSGIPLWQRLRAGRLQGFKFKRQQPIGCYIVDFVCFDRRLVVEVDGSQHIDQAGRDAVGTAWLESQDLVVLRFWNDDVLHDTDVVLAAILHALESGRG